MTKRTIQYRADIDGLRAIAVLFVIAYHAFPSLVKSGFIGVDIFFVISGYLISMVVFEKLQNDTFSFTDFYGRRILRIFPALLTVLITFSILGWFYFLDEEYKQLGKHLAAGAGFVSNLVLLDEANYFDSAAITKPLLHLWSLAIEEQFYIIWPALLWGAWQTKLNPSMVIIFITLLSFLFNILEFKTDTSASFYLPQARFWELASGGLLAWKDFISNNSVVIKTSFPKLVAVVLNCLNRCHSKRVYQVRFLLYKAVTANCLCLLGTFFLIYGFWSIKNELAFGGLWALWPVLGTVLIIGSGPNAWINKFIFSAPILVWFGLISFSLYLWHWPLLVFATLLEGETPSRIMRVIIIFFGIFISWVSYTCIERPARSGKTTQLKVLAVTLLMFLVGVYGCYLYFKVGYVFRPHSSLTLAPDEKVLTDERNKYWAGNLERNFGNATKKVVIFGDSQGFDIYKALLNDDSLGLKMFRSRPDCTSFNLTKLGFEPREEECRTDYKTFLASNEVKLADVIIYSVYWNKDIEPLNAIENYKSVVTSLVGLNPKVKIVFFGPKPLLGRHQKSIATIVRRQSSSDDLNEFLNQKKWLRETDTAYVQRLANQLELSFVDVNSIFCLDGCQFYETNRFTHFDQNHWTEFGAQVFFKKLARSKNYVELFK